MLPSHAMHVFCELDTYLSINVRKRFPTSGDGARLREVQVGHLREVERAGGHVVGDLKCAEVEDEARETYREEPGL